MDDWEQNYCESVPVLKALADNTRLSILRMLYEGELCACRIQEHFDISQPTLSYHMKILMTSGLVKGRKDGLWMRYSINTKSFESARNLLDYFLHSSDKNPVVLCCTQEPSA